MSRRTRVFALIAALTLVPATVQAGGKNDPVGTWLITVSVPGGDGDLLPPPEPFQQLVTFHKNGTVSETNNSLHANSEVPGETLNFNGSDGQGVWDKGPKKTVRYRILKMVFDGFTDDFLGFLVMEGAAKIDGDVFTQSAQDASISLVFDSDPENPDALWATYGGADAMGSRVALD